MDLNFRSSILNFILSQQTTIFKVNFIHSFQVYKKVIEDFIQIQTCITSKLISNNQNSRRLMNTYQDGYKRTFSVKSGTFQHVFCVFIWYLICALPFYFSFGGEKFWQRPKNQMLACQYNFTGIYAIQVNYVASNMHKSEQFSNVVGSSMSGVSGFSGMSVNDDKSEAAATFTLNGFDGKELQNVNVILYFKVWIEELGKQISASFAQSFNGDLSYAETMAILRYEPQEQLNAIDNRRVLNSPAYLPNLKPPTSFDSLMDHIVENHQVHRLNHESTQTTVTSQQSQTRQFKINLIKDTKVNIPYYPSVLQTLKFAFSKWLAFVIIAYFVFYKLMEKLVKDGGLVAKKRDEVIQ